MAAALAALAALVYRKILRLWWMYDDAFLVNMLKPASLGDVWHDRALYAKLGRPIFNPLLMLSETLDLQRFGAEPHAFYVHQLVAFALLPPLLYLLLRLWAPRAAAAITAVVFTISGPSLQVVPQLMLRHYVEGAVLATASMILFVLAVRRQSWPLALGSAILYFCATSAKEVYGPFLLILLVMPEGSWRLRARLAIPHAIAAVAFAIWRGQVIGWSVAQFGFVVPSRERPRVISTILPRAVREFAGSGSAAGWALLVAVLLCAAIVIVRLRDARLTALAAIVALVAPLVPVGAEMNPRWAFAPWLVACMAIAFLPRALPQGGTVAALLVLVVALVAYRVEWSPAYRLFLRMSDEARVFSHLGGGDILRDPATPPASLQELARLTGGNGRAFYDDLPLCNGTQQYRRLFEYDSKNRQVHESSDANLRRSCASIRQMPLELQLHFERNGAFYWTAGPYRDGKWAFILWDGFIGYEVPREAGFRSPGLDHFNLRVRYTSPAGWKTYSPMLHADSDKPPLVFRQ
ncbi:MAG TPA: hypothetical protein VG323_18815 [Thermoanaerobaculia bacterium]|nr:hypothetical protein [Thermoanaerobaculia bacterium]